MTSRANFARVKEASAVVRVLRARGLVAYLERPNRAARGSYINHTLLVTDADAAVLNAATVEAGVKFGAWRPLGS